MEWIRFWITAVLLTAGVIAFASAVLGVWRLGFSMNRMHAAGIGDTLAIFCVTAALVISSSSVMEALKLLLLVFFLWLSSPVSTHLLGQVEYFNNPELRKYVRSAERKSGEEPDERVMTDKTEAPVSRKEERT